MIITLVGLVLLVGLLMYVLASKDKLVEIGRIMFFCGLFVLLLNTDKVVTVLTR